MQHKDYITHLDQEGDETYLRQKHFPVNMRLFKTSLEYRTIIQQQCRYIQRLCLRKMDGYKLPHGMSSANAGLSFNIIAVQNPRLRGTRQAIALVMINPEIRGTSKETEIALSNCGSLTLKEHIKVKRYSAVDVQYYDMDGTKKRTTFNRKEGSFTIQHEIDHNNGILITDRCVK